MEPEYQHKYEIGDVVSVKGKEGIWHVENVIITITAAGTKVEYRLGKCVEGLWTYTTEEEQQISTELIPTGSPKQRVLELLHGMQTMIEEYW